MAQGKKIILITGANTGIGYETALLLARASPSNHVIISARSVERGTKALTELQGRGLAGTLSFVQLDVSSDESIEAAAKQLERDFGVIDVLVNNAAIVHWGAMTREELRHVFETNTFGPALLTQTLEPLLRRSKDPRIINVSSNLGSITIRTDRSFKYDGLSSKSYRMSKAALNMLTASQNSEFKDWEHPAKVWSFCPGRVNTRPDEHTPDNTKESEMESPETSAWGIWEIIQGKRDQETDLFITKRGEVLAW